MLTCWNKSSLEIARLMCRRHRSGFQPLAWPFSIRPPGRTVQREDRINKESKQRSDIPFLFTRDIACWLVVLSPFPRMLCRECSCRHWQCFLCWECSHPQLCLASSHVFFHDLLWWLSTNNNMCGVLHFLSYFKMLIYLTWSCWVSKWLCSAYLECNGTNIERFSMHIILVYRMQELSPSACLTSVEQKKYMAKALPESCNGARILLVL